MCLPTYYKGVKGVMCESRMKMTFKFRAKPTKTEAQWLLAELQHQKQLQNYMLQMRNQMWDYGRKSVSMYDQIHHLPHPAYTRNLISVSTFCAWRQIPQL